MRDPQYPLVEQFEKELNDLGGEAFLVKEAEVHEKLETILSENVQNVVVYQTALLKRILPEDSLQTANDLSIHWLLEIRPPDLDYKNYRQMLIKADTSIIAADYLIADSGSIVLLGKHHRSQMVTLLPSTLIILATANQIVESIHSLHKKLKTDNQDEKSIHYIAGPSRTADIEKNLILGVHGPEDLYVLVISEE